MTASITLKEPRADAGQQLISVEQWAERTLGSRKVVELLDGRLIEKMTTTNAHNWAAEEFLFACKMWAGSSGWCFLGQGPGVRINSHTLYEPDVTGYPPGSPILPGAAWNEHPFLVVEVLSPGTAVIDRGRKLLDYATIGVRLYLMVDLSQRLLEVRRLQSDGYGEPELLSRDASWQPAELPGLKVELSRLWMEVA